MAIDPSIPLQVRPFQLESPLAQASQAYGLMNLLQQGDMNRLKLKQAADADAREREYRAAISGATTPEEQLAVASRFMGPDKLGTMIQGAQTKQAQIAATKEAAMARLQQAAQQFQMNYEARLRTVRTQEERVALEQQRVAFEQQLKSEAARLAGAQANYNFGFMPAPPPQPTVAAAPTQAIPPSSPLSGLTGAPPPPPPAPPLATGRPAGFPVVTPQVQAQRNAEQVAILTQELQNEKDPANQAAIRAEIAKLSGPNPFAPGGPNPVPPALPGGRPLPQRVLDQIEAAKQREAAKAVAPTRLPAGFRWKDANNPELGMEPIPGSAPDIRLKAAQAKDKKAAEMTMGALNAELENINRLIGPDDAKPKLHPGLASATGPIDVRFPTVFTNTANAEAYIKSLQSKASISALQSIRGMSQSIGQITEREWPRLESMKATLQESQGTPQFVQSLKDYRKEIRRIIDTTKSAAERPQEAAPETTPVQPGAVLKFDSQGNPIQ